MKCNVKKYLFSFIMILLLCSCSNTQKERGTLVYSFEESVAPSKIIKIENNWISLVSTYGSSNYEISVSKEAETLQSVYNVEDVSIWFMEANDSYVVWCEQSEAFYEYKLYSIEDGTVQTFFTTDTEAGFQLQNVGMQENQLFYSYIDYEKQEANIFCYDIVTEQHCSLYALPYEEDLSIMSFSVENGYLSVASAEGIFVMELESENVVLDIDMPQDVLYIFAISFDSINEMCAIYYADSDSEDIGLLSSKEPTPVSIFTFRENYYAYHDRIKCQNGHIYWITQANVSGNVAEHYRLVDYDYLKHTPTEVMRAFDFYLNDSNLYYLRFNQNKNYENIELYHDVSN